MQQMEMECFGVPFMMIIPIQKWNLRVNSPPRRVLKARARSQVQGRPENEQRLPAVWNRCRSLENTFKMKEEPYPLVLWPVECLAPDIQIRSHCLLACMFAVEVRWQV
jgi:hypothetical protein